MEYNISKSVQVRVSNIDKINTNFKISNEKIQIDNSFLEAILIASPSLYESIKKFKTLNKKSKLKVIKSVELYSRRISSRATPFGIFSSVGLGTFDCTNNSKTIIYKKVFPTMEWLFKLSNKLITNRKIFDNLKVKWNELVISSYKLILYKNDETLVVKNSDILKNIRQKTSDYIKVKDLIILLQQYVPQYSNDDIRKYILQLIKKEILISTLAPTTNNAGQYFDYLLRICVENQLIEGKRLLTIQQKIIRYEKVPIGEGLNDLEELIHLMNQIVRVEKPIFVDSFVQNNYKIDKKYLEGVKNVNEILEKISIKQNYDEILSKYAQNFIEKYGINVAVPVKEVFDPVLGLGNPYSILEKRKTSINLNKRFVDIITKKIILDFHEDELIADLTHEIDSNFQNRNVNNLSEGYDLFTTPLSDNKNYSLLVNPNTGFNSPKNVWGRFNYMFDNQFETVNDINILSIPFNKKLLDLDDKSIKHKGKKLMVGFNSDGQSNTCLNDILVYVYQNDQKKIRFAFVDKSLSKNISFKISSMLNFKRYDTYSPLLRFLLEISYLNKPNMLEPINYINNFDFPRIPRFTYKNVILTPAQWKVKVDVIYQSKKIEQSITKIYKYLKKLRCPDNVYFLKYDVKTKYDLREKNDIKELIDILNKDKEITLIEDTKSEEVNHKEYVFSLNKRKVFKRQHFVTAYHMDDSRSFLPNSQNKWIYYKLFTSQYLFKDVVKEVISPLIHKLQSAKLIDNFFYIYYLTPSPHIRVRFHLRHLNMYGQIKKIIDDKLADCVSKHQISSLSIDTYDQELERYGGKKYITKIENVFNIDSSMCLKNLDIFRANYIYNTLSVCNLLYLIGIKSPQKIEEILSYYNTEENNELYGKEANSINRKLFIEKNYKIFSKRFKDIQKSNDQVFDSYSINTNYQKQICISLIHLHCNRLLFNRKDELKNEFIMYKIISTFCKKEKYYADQQKKHR